MTDARKARLSELRVGDVVSLDDGFTCRLGQTATVEADERGSLIFACAAGAHYIAAHLHSHDHDTLAGMTLLKSDAPPARDRRPPFFVRVALWVMMISFAWLVVFCAAGGAAFVVSMLGGDVVTWLLGVPFGLAVAGAVVAVVGVIVTGWERGDAG
jgi:hypothetical protein